MDKEQFKAMQAPLKEKYRRDADAPNEKLDKLVELTERYCVVLQSLRQPTEIRSTRV